MELPVEILNLSFWLATYKHENRTLSVVLSDIFLQSASVILWTKQRMDNTDNATTVYVSLFLIKPQNSLDVSN